MTIAHEFDYCAPDTLEEAIAVLGAAEGSHMVLAGGTDLVAWLRDDVATPDLVVDLKNITGLDHIDADADGLRIGALVTFADLLRSEVVAKRTPLMVETAATVGSTGIRNRATMAGNICSAVPSCDAGPALLVHDATVEVMAAAGPRSIPMTSWFVGPHQSALAAGEIVTGIRVPVPPTEHGAAYVRLSRYRGEDLAQAGVAVMVTPDHDYRVAFGAVAATPFRSRRIEAKLSGQELDDDLIAEAVGLVATEVSPITDVRASKRFRLRMSEVMLERGLRTAVDRLRGEGPPYGADLM